MELGMQHLGIKHATVKLAAGEEDPYKMVSIPYIFTAI